MRNYELEYSDICGLVNTANFFITGFPFFHNNGFNENNVNSHRQVVALSS